MDVPSVPVVAVISCALGLFQRLGNDGGNKMTSAIYQRCNSLRCPISCTDEVVERETSFQGRQEARFGTAKK